MPSADAPRDAGQQRVVGRLARTSRRSPVAAAALVGHLGERMSVGDRVDLHRCRRAHLAGERRSGRAAAAGPGRGRPTCRRLVRLRTTCHSCWVRPTWIGSATASTRPSRCARRKSVLLETPTTTCPVAADVERRTDRGQRLHHRAPHPAVDDALGLVVPVVAVEVGRPPGRARAVPHQAEGRGPEGVVLEGELAEVVRLQRLARAQPLATAVIRGTSAPPVGGCAPAARGTWRR
jgi:hypothetical protein